jgi:hypothetical protein
MQVNAGVQIHLNVTGGTVYGDDASIGMTGGVLTFTEDESNIPVGVTNYMPYLLTKNWDSGAGKKIPLQDHPRPEVISGGKISIDNLQGYYQSLLDLGIDITGKMITRVYYTDDVVGDYTKFTNYIKAVKPSSRVVELELGDIKDQMNADMSYSIDGDTWAPLIIGDHEKGVWVGSGVEFTDIDSTKWGFVVDDLSSTPDNVVFNFATREATTALTLETVPEDTTKALLDYAYTADNLYFVVDSGGGDGKSIKTYASAPDGNVIDILLEAIPDYISDAWEIKGATGEGSITTNVSTGNLKLLNSLYYTDPNIVSSGSSLVNEDGESLPVDAWEKSGQEVTVTPKVLEGDNIAGYDLAEFTSCAINSADAIQSTGTFVYDSDGVWIEKSYGTIATTPSGATTNTIDRDDTTNYNTSTVWSVGTPTNPSYSAKVALSLTLEGDLGQIESLINDIDTTISLTGSGVIKTKTNIRAYYVWDTGGGVYKQISSPVNSVNYEPATNLVGGVVNSCHAITRDTPAGYYEDPNTTYTNYNKEYYKSAYELYTSGVESFATTDDFSGKKKPTQLQLEIVTDITVDSIAPAEPQIDVTVDYKVYGLGMIANSSGVTISDKLFTSVSGRPWTTMQLYQDKVSRHQNGSRSNLTSVDWGLEESLDMTVTQNVANTTPVRAQWTDKGHLNTKYQIERLIWEGWNACHVNALQTVVWDGFLDSIGAESPTHSFVLPNSDKVKGKDTDTFNKRYIFNAFEILYNWDEATQSYLGKISLSKDTAEGITSSGVATELKTKCETLYNISGGSQALPDARSKLRLIYTEADAIEYINQCMQFYGIIDGSYYRPHMEITVTHDVQDFLAMDLMETIGYTIPNLTGGVEATGVIVGIDYKSGEGAQKLCDITSIIRASDTVGVIEEKNGNTDTIEELQPNTDTISEVGK